MIEVRNVSKTFRVPHSVKALVDVSARIEAGEVVVVIGPSGSGTSTMLNMITGIDRPTGGEVYIAGTGIHKLNEGEMAKWRGRNQGVIFQFFQLLPTLTVIENVILPMDFCHLYTPRERHERRRGPDAGGRRR